MTLVAGCGTAEAVVPVTSTPVCNRPDQPPGTETQVPVDGFVTGVAIAGNDVWAAVRGGRLAKLDPFCDLTIVTINVVKTLWPKIPAGQTPDFTAFVSDGDGILWAVVELVELDGTATAAAVVRFDAHTEKVTATLPLATLPYRRTHTGLAVRGDSVWVADAQTPGTAARLDPRTAAVVATVHTPLGARPANQDIAVDNRGLLWLPGGPKVIDVLDATGTTVDTVPLPDLQAAAPGIAPDDGVVWVTGATTHQISDTGRTLLATAQVPMAKPSPDNGTVWGIQVNPDAVVQVADDGTTVLAHYPVLDPTIAFLADSRDLWRVDVDGVLHRIAV